MAKKRVKKKVARQSPKFAARKIKFNAPLSVKIVSIFFYIVSILTILAGLLVVLGGILGIALFASFDTSQLSQFVPSFSVLNELIDQGLFTAVLISGLAIILWGLLQFFIGKGLWGGRKLAYIASAIILLIGFILSLSLVLALSWSALFGLILYSILGYLLFFDKKTRQFFNISLKLLKSKR